MKTIIEAKAQFILSMLIFGTIGIFVHYIPLSSSVIACVRGLVGMLFLLLLMRVRKIGISKAAIRKNGLLLCLSGGAIGMNWILLFEAYRYTTIATATLCYYLAPVFVILVSPVFLRERLSVRKLLCAGVSLGGMVFVSGVVQSGMPSQQELAGILCGIGAAMLYATVIILNKKILDVPAYDKTVMQLGTAAAAVLVYILLTENASQITLTPASVVLLLVVGVVHTGIAYVLYFGAMKNLKAQTIAIFSYIDPVAAILLSWLFLQERMDVWSMVGAVMILGSAMMSELQKKS